MSTALESEIRGRPRPSFLKCRRIFGVSINLATMGGGKIVCHIVWRNDVLHTNFFCTFDAYL